MNRSIKLFGWRICFYSGKHPYERPRLWFWKFDGVRNINRGVTLCSRNGFCLGIQWRRLLPDFEI